MRAQGLIGGLGHLGQHQIGRLLRHLALRRAEQCAVSPNRILAGLSGADFAFLEPHLEPIDLPVRKRLETSKRRIDHVYFIEAGFASVVANGSNKPSIEIGIVGREGMTGLAVLLGGERAAHECYIQVAGKGLRISAPKLREADERSPTLHRAMLRYAHNFLLQTTTTALANGRSKIEERLARWLLMAHDRLDGDDVPLTHEFLGLMLGTHRPGVTLALQTLEMEGLIAARRSRITILDRKGLRKWSNGAYVPTDP
jgi:CRP-like cAMP-binding protein